MLGQYGISHKRPKREVFPEIAAGVALLRAGVGMHHMRWIQDDRAKIDIVCT